MTPKDTPADPRSLQTDRKRFMTRSLHTPRIVTTVAVYIAKRDKLSSPTEAVRRALRFLDIKDDYNADIDPTMRACVEQTNAALGK